jgi:hypothetical protein
MVSAEGVLSPYFLQRDNDMIESTIHQCKYYRIYNKYPAQETYLRFTLFARPHVDGRKFFTIDEFRPPVAVSVDVVN